MDMHVQCALEKPNADGTGMTQNTCWIPEKFAVVGKIIKIKENGVWDDGWTVKATYTRAASKQVLERQNDYRNTREASDI